jgi:hypothetical protein
MLLVMPLSGKTPGGCSPTLPPNWRAAPSQARSRMEIQRCLGRLVGNLEINVPKPWKKNLEGVEFPLG